MDETNDKTLTKNTLIPLIISFSVMALCLYLSTENSVEKVKAPKSPTQGELKTKASSPQTLPGKLKATNSLNIAVKSNPLLKKIKLSFIEK